MLIHQVYAQIFEEKIKNIVVCDNYEMANYLARATYGDTAFAVDCSQYPCQINDRYINQTFYQSDGTTMITCMPTQEQQIQILETENTDLQLALVELYEELGV